ncbi:ABC transporter substrate-binding protein [Aquabacter spiritensis]|uniref:Amino acid/amide ABC transporter substrate-binding protein (HAAT family) n=1 Tax=Aquabacter spiritensis TaxID=933073 RepID=A0A4R3LXS7_9HYPH|nr:ABC transporter substrate-binding protein [Aquabacter spiritensis]TCT05460.1 amino acid/amide ABC transporter substrate-binding protein (HAAT family) [Aquabacter spiritensis]
MPHVSRFRLPRAALVAAAMLAAQPALAQSPGVTDTSIKLGTIAPITGNTPAVGMLGDGMDLKFKAVNAAGGVKMGDGKTRTIEFIVTDDANEPPRALTNTRRMVEQNQIFALVGVVGTLQNQAIRSYITQRKVPSLFVYSGVYEFGMETQNPMSTSLVPSFTTESAIYAEYLKQKKPNAKVAILYLNTDFGQNFVAGFKAAINGSNITLVDAQPHNYSDPTVDTQLTNLKASGADTLLIATVPKPAAQAVRFAAESGWKPLTMITYAASSPIALRPAGVENLQGVITGQFMKPIESDAYANDAGVKSYLADYERFKPRFNKGDTLGQMGYTIAEGVVMVLQNMKEPTREAFLDTARHMAGIELSLLLPGIKLTSNGTADPFPIEAMQLFVFKGEGYVPETGVIAYEGKTPKL